MTRKKFMTSPARVSTAVLAKNLRTRLAQLQTKRKSDLARFHKEFEAWKKAVADHLASPEVRKKIAGVGIRETGNRYSSCSCCKLPSRVLIGLPKRPYPPSDDAIRMVQRTLRYIALTGTSFMTVTPDDAQKWLGDDEPREEETDE